MMRCIVLFISLLFLSASLFSQINSLNYTGKEDSFSNHKLLLDNEGKLLPWYQPKEMAYDHFLRQRWNFIKTSVPNAPGPGITSLYPQYYFYCAYRDVNGTLQPDQWMNDIGEKIPNWFESARLYYTYTGDMSVMKIIKDLVDYQMVNGLSSPDFKWPGFPFATADAGDSIYRGFTTTDRFRLHETQVDHSAEMGLTYLNLYLFYGEKKYFDAAVKVADVLAAKVRKGSLKKSPLPYIVNAQTGESRSEYGANWTGCYTLLEKLADMNHKNKAAYQKACGYIKDFLLQYPLKTGYWTDGHSDTYINSHTYKSNLSANNFTLFLFDNPGFTPKWKQYLPELISWTEKHFVDSSAPGETGRLWGANIVGEQEEFMYKMDYQTARYAAACARWYALSGDPKYKEKAYRSLNLVTYCSDSNGKANESPLSTGISNWWSDCYGEGPRMFYHAFAGVPEWAPPRENHILYSAAILNNVHYEQSAVSYNAVEEKGIDFLRLNFKPSIILLNDNQLSLKSLPGQEGYTIRHLENGDYAVQISREHKGKIIIRAGN